jgi:PAS domain S-box-containing protein
MPVISIRHPRRWPGANLAAVMRLTLLDDPGRDAIAIGAGKLARATSTTPRASWLRVLRWIAGLASVSLLIVAVAFGLVVTQAFVPIRLEHLLASALLVAAAALLYLYVSYRQALGVMHRGILRAQEGTLLPVSVPRFADRFLRRLISDQNLLITNLGTTFFEMEECQNHVIGERNRNDAILHSLPGALVCVDGEQRVNLSNLQAQRLFGLTRDSLTGRNLFDLLALDDAGRELLRDAFLYERPVVNSEIVLRMRDEPHYFAMNVSFFESKNLNDTGAVVILQDITDYKHLQEHTYTMEKLGAMGQLAAGVAHELNTPLGNIIGYARLMAEAGADTEQMRRYTQVVSHEAKRCARIVDDLLKYARRDLCQAESCELNAITKDVVETVVQCQGARFNAAVSFNAAPSDLPVTGSPGQLDIVLVNLLMNAIQASAGSTPRPCVAVLVRPQGSRQAAVIVEDNGPGVAPELRRRIFDPFFTTKEVGKGTGLGLAISQAIVTKLGGSLQYDPTFRRGARFVLTLPLAQAETLARGG